MTDLTEQWKKGELPEGYYYIKNRNETNIDEYIQWYKDHGIPSEKSFAYFNVQQVLAPVPSYEEWKTSYNCMLENEVLRLKNAQLKELLKECRSPINYALCLNLSEEEKIEFKNLLANIKQVLGEDK